MAFRLTRLLLTRRVSSFQKLTLDGIIKNEHPTKNHLMEVDSIVEKDADLKSDKKRFIVRLHIQSRLGDWTACKQTISDMKKYKIKSNTVVLNSVAIAMKTSGECQDKIDGFLQNYLHGKIDDILPDASSIVTIVSCASSLKNATEYVEYYKSRYKQIPDKFDMRSAFIKVCLSDKNSYSMLKKIEDSNPRNRRDLFNIIQSYVFLEKYSDALYLWDRLVDVNRKKLSPKDIELLLSILTGYHSRKKPFGKVLERVRSYLPTFRAAAFAQLAAIAVKTNDRQAVEEVHRLARVMRKDSRTVLLILNPFYSKSRRAKNNKRKHPFFEIPS